MFILLLQATVAIGVLASLVRLYRRTVIVVTPKNLPGPPSVSWTTGNLTQMYGPQAWGFHWGLQAKYGGAVKIHAFFGNEQIYFSDPRALHHVVVKDQEIFEETAMFLESNQLVFGDGLLAITGDKHRKQRKMLNPVFSIAHMRNLIPTFNRITNKLRGVMVSNINRGENEFDILNLMSCAALEFIGEGGLGYPFGTLDGAPKPFVQAMKDFLPTMLNLSLQRYFLPYVRLLGPPRFRRFLLELVPNRHLQRLKEVADTMYAEAVHIYTSKKRALESGDKAVIEQVLGDGHDILSVLMRANMAASEKERLTEEEVLGLITQLVFAATDTTSTALSRTLHLLSTHPEMQKRLQDEVREALAHEGGDLPYDTLVSLPLLDAVCRETLRLYPPVTFLNRTCRKDTVVPLYTPVTGTDGAPIHEVVVRAGQNVMIGIAACNRNTDLWGLDAEVWRPDRWLEPLPESLAGAKVPGVYANTMTFLGGGRACIGFKFSQLEMKVVLAMLVSTFSYALPDGGEITWKMSNVSAPCLKGRETETPHMPLKVSLVKA